MTITASANTAPTSMQEVNSIGETVGNSEIWDAYVYFSDQLFDKGVVTNLCYELFYERYDAGSDESLMEYADRLIEAESYLASNIYSVGMATNIVDSNLSVIQNIPDIETLSAESVNSGWYDNLGTSNPTLPQAASYDKYNLLSVVSIGDIIYEQEGSVASITGHIAIVQGIFYDSNYQQNYIRTIESIATGVVYGALDDERYDDRGVTVYELKTANLTANAGAITFCSYQLGKPFNWAGIVNGGGGSITPCNSTSSSSAWYCSELVWAAYYNQGINFNGSGIPYNIFYPSELASSSLLKTVSVS